MLTHNLCITVVKHDRLSGSASNICNVFLDTLPTMWTRHCVISDLGGSYFIFINLKISSFCDRTVLLAQTLFLPRSSIMVKSEWKHFHSCTTRRVN